MDEKSSDGNRTLRAGLIGYGLAGSVFHAPLIAAAEGLALDTVVTASPERQQQARDPTPGRLRPRARPPRPAARRGAPARRAGRGRKPAGRDGGRGRGTGRARRGPRAVAERL